VALPLELRLGAQSRAIDKLVDCIIDLMSKSFDHWMKGRSGTAGARGAFEDLDLVVCKLKVSSTPSLCLEMQSLSHL